MSYHVSADYARQNFDLVIQEAQKEAEGIVITKGEKKFVLIEQSKLEAALEAAQFEQLPNLFKNIAS